MNRQMMGLIRFILPILALGLVVGCSSNVSVEDNRTAQVAFDEAMVLIDSGSFAPALPLLEKSIASGGLSADLYATALILRSRCYSDAGELDKAQADLDHAEQGTPSPAQFQLAKGSLLAKQGKKSESDAAFKAAKKADPSIKIPK